METLVTPARTPDALANEPALRTKYAQGGLHQIAAFDVTAGAPQTFEFQAIPQTFKHLRLVGHLRSDVAGSTFDNLRITCNADVTDANYFYQATQMANNAPVGTQNLGAANSRAGILIQGANSPANLFSTLIIDIMNYAKPRPTVIKTECDITLGFTTGNIFRRSHYLIWNNNAPLDRLLFECQNVAGHFVIGSSMDLYGVMPGFT